MSDKVVEAYNDNEAAMGPAGRLREYLPEFLGNIRELGQVLQAEQPYFQQAWRAGEPESGAWPVGSSFYIWRPRKV